MQARRFGKSGALAIAGLAGGLMTGCAVTPDEFSGAELDVMAVTKLGAIAAQQEAIAGPIDLNEAIARALKYNLDHQVELAEQAVRERELRLSHYSLLPGLVAESGYAGRDKVHASNSVNVLTGDESLATSTSQDKRLRTADIAFSWNILDFGLSWVRARQAADKVLVQSELRRKIALRVFEDVGSAYWRAVSAQRLLGRLARVEEQARKVERDARSLATDQKTSAITALTYEREIVEVQRTIGEITRELNTALTELGSLMNIKPGSKFRVVEGRGGIPSLPAMEMRDLVHMAIINRPELREVEYRRRINEQEAHAALLEMLPGLQLVAGANWDSNSFLLHNDWANWGAKASWNLMRVFSYPAKRDVIEEQDELFNTKSLAVTMAIMTQVYVSRVRFAHAVKEHRTAKKLRDVQSDLLTQIRAESAAGRVSQQTLVREELNAVVAEAKLDLAYAAVRGAYANMRASIGLEPYPQSIAPNASIKELAGVLRGSLGAGVWTTSMKSAQ